MEKERLAIRDLPASETPRARALSFGTAALSTAELLQLTCGVGYLDICPTLLSRAGELRDLAKMTAEEIAATPGIGIGGAVAIRASIELGKRLATDAPGPRESIRSPADAYHILKPMIEDSEQECMVVLSLNTKNHVIDANILYVGNVNTSVIRVAEIFRRAIRKNAVSIILGHNHPSGDPAPSPEDVRVTERIVEAGHMIDIDVLDHIIVGAARFISLKERNLGGFNSLR